MFIIQLKIHFAMSSLEILYINKSVFMLTLYGLLSLLILMMRHVNADGQLYVYLLCVFLLTLPVNTIQFILTCCLWP